MDQYSTIYLIFRSSPKNLLSFLTSICIFIACYCIFVCSGWWIQNALKSARMLKSIPEEFKDDSWNLSYNVDSYLSPRESFGSTSNPSSAIILLRASKNSPPPLPSTYFSRPSRMINSCLPKGRLNIDRCRLTISARGFTLLISPWRHAQYLSLKFSAANFRSDFSSI